MGEGSVTHINRIIIQDIRITPINQREKENPKKRWAKDMVRLT